MWEDGTVVGFGNDAYGNLAQSSSSSYRPTPVKFLDPNNVLQYETVVSIAVMEGTTMMLTSDGKVATVGSNKYGNLGIGMTPDNVAHPTIVQVSIGKNISAISAGMRHAVMLATDGTIYSFGQAGTSGCLGLDAN